MPHSRFCQVLISILATIIVLAGCEQPAEPEAAEQQNLDAMSREHAEDTTEATPITVPEPARPVRTEVLPYGEVDNELVYGHFTIPVDMLEPLPAIIVFHEWWGLNDNVRAMSDRLAGEGYIVLAVDLYGGEVATSPDEARTLMQGVIENRESALDNIRQAIEFVGAVAGAPSTATLGWCFGGSWSINTALSFPDSIDASVIYYGQVPSEEDALNPLQSPVIGFFGAEDKGIPIDSVRAFEASLKSLDKDHEVHIYDGADHAFANPTGNRYKQDAAEDAWLKTLDFLRQELGSSASDSSSSGDST